MVHVLFVDPLEKLDLKKDSTMLLAASLQDVGEEVYFLFEEDFYLTNDDDAPVFNVYGFEAIRAEESFYLEKVELKGRKLLALGRTSLLHMRLDPPFDARYLRYQWMLRGLKKLYGIQIINDPDGVLLNNEKIAAYQLRQSVSSFIGSSVEDFYHFAVKQQENGYEGLVLKPLDLFQGMGVEQFPYELDQAGSWPEVAAGELKEHFERKVEESQGPIVAQPFLKEVQEGEVRSLFFQGKHLGSILKVPPHGEFLANIAQGAKYSHYELSKEKEEQCFGLCRELARDGVLWVAFDILGGKIQEVNVTCPGLLVEVSEALGRNLAFDIIDILKGEESKGNL